ncbi:TPA: hypothetical protein ACSTLU_000113 [Serratia fonticola]
MKSNRQARRLFGMRRWISNTRLCSGEDCLLLYWCIKPSRRQRRAEQRRFKWLRENADYSCDYAQVEAKL